MAERGRALGNAAPEGPARWVSELFRSERPRILRYVRGRVRDAEDAQDIVQEAFVRLAAAAETPRVPEAYLRRVVRNLLVDRAKRLERRVVRRRLGLDEASLPPVPPEQEWAIEAEQLEARYVAALAGLPEKTRAVFLMHRVDELDYRGIAERVGVSVSTVEYHMARALVHLERALR